MRRKIVIRQRNQTLLFCRRNRLQRMLIVTGTNLNKNDLVAFTGNQIDLTITATPVTSDNRVSASFQIRCCRLFTNIA